jgi:hypothetical protein
MEIETNCCPIDGDVPSPDALCRNHALVQTRSYKGSRWDLVLWLWRVLKRRIVPVIGILLQTLWVYLVRETNI